MLFPVFLDNGSDLSHNLNGTISHVLFLIVEQAIKQWEDSATNTLVAHLSKVLSDQLHKWRKLIQKSLFDVWSFVFGLWRKMQNQ